jgi:hypothetical protein
LEFFCMLQDLSHQVIKHVKHMSLFPFFIGNFLRTITLLVLGTENKRNQSHASDLYPNLA